MSFDRLADLYSWLERFAFGGSLARARFFHLRFLADRARILILGEGDGRFLAELICVSENATVHCVDESFRMIEIARSRLHLSARSRVDFVRRDALDISFHSNQYDAVVTLFFLDCFEPSKVRDLVDRVGKALVPNGLWCWTDFGIPHRGWRRMRARVWISLLYTFFRIFTNISARKLPPTEEILKENGFEEVESRIFQQGLLKATIFRNKGGHS